MNALCRWSKMWKNAVMDIAVLKKLGVAAAFVLLGAGAAFARAPEPGRGMPNQPTDFRHQGGNGFGNGGGRPPPDQDANQRRGKLSPDERRELRRQIDEAGQDIYRVNKR